MPSIGWLTNMQSLPHITLMPEKKHASLQYAEHNEITPRISAPLIADASFSRMQKTVIPTIK
jgi:hypothetical protein